MIRPPRISPLFPSPPLSRSLFPPKPPPNRGSQYLTFPLEERVAFLKQEELTLDDYLKKLPIPNRPGAQVPPRFPPYFGTEDRERRSRMIEECANPNGELARRIQQIWLPLFQPQ